MTAAICYWVGHRWRFISRERIRSDGLTWTVFLCQRCPARWESAECWDPPEPGGLFTKGDLITLAIAGPIIFAILAAAAGAS